MIKMDLLICFVLLGLGTCLEMVGACSEHCVCRFAEDEVIVGVDCSNRVLNELPQLNDHYEVCNRCKNSLRHKIIIVFNFRLKL